ncbi:MAG TPA: hypothetical protein VM451_05720 [Candidatus Limnocylindria bacterium]|nr:hypothetical protein [Candidatus Limnocylindria bacterium]
MSTPNRASQVIVTALVAITLAACGGGAGATSLAAQTPQGTPAGALATQLPTATVMTTSASPASMGPSGPPVSNRPTDVPSRVVMPDLRIDLPVISGDATVPGNPADYPLCDVAQYLTTFPYPGRLGATTWIYGHAREGMLLELLLASERADGAELIGAMVDVYSTANIRYRYRISEVLRHATDRSAAQGVPPDQGRLILQTSEGPRGTVPKLQVVAGLVETLAASPEESRPSAAPRGCFVE